MEIIAAVFSGLEETLFAGGAALCLVVFLRPAANRPETFITTGRRWLAAWLFPVLVVTFSRASAQRVLDANHTMSWDLDFLFRKFFFWSALGIAVIFPAAKLYAAFKIRRGQIRAKGATRAARAGKNDIAAGLLFLFLSGALVASLPGPARLPGSGENYFFHAAGYYFLYALGGSFALQSLFPRLQARRVKVLCAAALWLALSLQGVVSAQQTARDFDSALAAVRGDVEMTAALAGAESPAGALDMRPKTGGAAGNRETWALTELGGILRLRRNYLVELQFSGIARLLDPQRLSQDTALTGARNILGAANGVVQKYAAGFQNQREQVGAEVIRLEAEGDAGGDIAAAVNNFPWEKVAGPLEVESAVLAEDEKIIRLLELQQGLWQVQAGKVEFFSKDGEAAWRGSLDNIARLEQGGTPPANMTAAGNLPPR